MNRLLALVLVFFPLFIAHAEDEDFQNDRARPNGRGDKRVEEDEAINTSVSTKPTTDAETRKKLNRGDGKLISWWSPETSHYSIGYEAAGSGTSVLGANNLTVGFWLPGDFGLDFYVGYNKAAGTSAESKTIAETGTTTKTRVTTTIYSGFTGASNMTLGLGLKGRGFQNSWFQFSYGLILAYGGPNKVEGRVGETIETVPDTTIPNTKSSVETAANGSAGYGTISTDTKSTISVGPKLGTEFYIKWFPHLALGFSTGLLATFGGESTQTITTRNRTVNTIAGTVQPDTSGTDGPTTTTVTTTPGYQASTFGIGGTQFQFTGTFTIRYVW